MLFFQDRKISFLAARDEALGYALKFFPTRPDILCLRGRYLVISGGAGDNGEQISKFLHNFVSRGNQVRGMRLVYLGIKNEESPGPLTNPLHQFRIFCAFEQGIDAIQGIGTATAGRDLRGFGPFIDHRDRQTKLSRDLLWTALLKDFPQDFVRLHGESWEDDAGVARRKSGTADRILILHDDCDTRGMQARDVAHGR